MKKEKKKFEGKLEIPNGVVASIANSRLKIKGKEGEVEREFKFLGISINIQEKEIIVSSDKVAKKTKKTIGTIKAHIKNMIRGVERKYVYKLKICSGHFPMNVSVNKGEFVVKNFFGEKVPRVLKLVEGVDVKVEGDIVNVASINKEVAGQCAASIESLTRRVNYDPRIFQDGIFITNKDDKVLK